MTEDEAKTKWCPFIRVTAGEREWHTNRPSHADVDAKPFDHCIGSACMAWRWAGTASQYPKRSDVPGYCGLAGAPQ